MPKVVLLNATWFLDVKHHLYSVTMLLSYRDKFCWVVIFNYCGLGKELRHRFVYFRTFFKLFSLFFITNNYKNWISLIDVVNNECITIHLNKNRNQIKSVVLIFKAFDFTEYHFDKEWDNRNSYFQQFSFTNQSNYFLKKVVPVIDKLKWLNLKH